MIFKIYYVLTIDKLIFTLYNYHTKYGKEVDSMRKIAGIMFVMLVAALVLVPAPVSAALGQDCTYDKVKWEDNPISSNLYLKNWGKTPLTAMSRLAGLAYPDALNSKACNSSGNCSTKRITGCDIPDCFGGCATNPGGAKSTGSCTVGETCTSCEKALTICNGCWGVSTAFANKSWGGCDAGTKPSLDNKHPNHLKGDWGVTGCPHPECVADKWCLPNNLCK
jgi:hypothetical protein